MALPVTQKVVLRIPDGTGNVDVVQVDGCVTEHHELPVTITSHPVEEGFAVSDHARPEPNKLTLALVHSNTPPNGNPDGEDRAAALWQRFVKLWESPQLIDLLTARASYTSMGIEKVSSPVDAKSANALICTVELKKVRVVQNKFTAVKKTTPKGQPKKDMGKTTSTSLAARLADTATGGAKSFFGGGG